MAPPNQHAIELRRHELMTPCIPRRADTGLLQCSDGSVEDRVVRTVGGVIVPPVGELTLGSGQTLHCFGEKRVPI